MLFLGERHRFTRTRQDQLYPALRTASVRTLPRTYPFNGGVRARVTLRVAEGAVKGGSGDVDETVIVWQEEVVGVGELSVFHLCILSARAHFCNDSVSAGFGLGIVLGLVRGDAVEECSRVHQQVFDGSFRSFLL